MSRGAAKGTERGSRVSLQANRKGVTASGRFTPQALKSLSQEGAHGGQRGVFSAEEDMAEARNEVMKYWFLLEKELLYTIVKGNYRYVEVAKAKINYLKEVICPELLKENLL